MRPKYLVSILVLLALALPASPAHAGGIVSVCDETHLLAALAGGGTVTFSCSGTIILTAEITIVADTTIDGSGQTVTISGNDTVRVFTVNAGVILSLNKVNIVHGYAASGSGGGIANNGSIIVTNSTFSDNYGYADGGGLYNGGTAAVIESIFTRNGAHYAGGAIYNGAGALTVTNSTLAGNGVAYGGGGIYNHDGTVIVSGSTLSGHAAEAGGAISNGGTLIVSNSTFFGNRAPGFDGGGGIYNYGTATVTNSTLAGNTADSSRGAGIQNDGTITLKNTIVGNSQEGMNCYGGIVDGGGNLSYPDTTCPGINLDPKLGTLNNNGGPTKTMSLMPGSAALDSAVDAVCAAPPVKNLDQRGITRRQGAHCDIGAFEARDPTTRRAFLPIIMR